MKPLIFYAVYLAMMYLTGMAHSGFYHSCFRHELIPAVWEKDALHRVFLVAWFISSMISIIGSILVAERASSILTTTKTP